MMKLKTAIAAGCLTGLWLQMSFAQQPSAYEVGDKIDQKVYVIDEGGKKRKLLELAEPDAKLIYLLIFGGPSLSDRTHGGLWCEDSFNDLPTSNYIHLKFADQGVQVIPVVCPPVYHEDLFGYDENVFLKAEEGSDVYLNNFRIFVSATKALQTIETIAFETVYFDPRFQFMLNHEKAEPGSDYAGEKSEWLGKFKPKNDSQTYSTPTVWLLSREGVVMHAPFFGNRYNPRTQKIEYTVLDVEKAVADALRNSDK